MTLEKATSDVMKAHGALPELWKDTDHASRSYLRRKLRYALFLRKSIDVTREMLAERGSTRERQSGEKERKEGWK
eukprot:1413659-Rhodomonas_salina.1